MLSVTHQSHDQAPLKVLRSLLQLALIACGAILLLMRPYLVAWVRSEEFAPGWLLVGPTTFLFLFLLYVCLDFYLPKTKLVPADYLRFMFAIFVIGLSFPSSFREYKARTTPFPLTFSVMQTFFRHEDARIRALALLAGSRQNVKDPAFLGLIHKGLLDKDPLVRQAALLIIEENLGIQLKSDAEGVNQAQLLIQEVSSQALLMKKGSP